MFIYFNQKCFLFIKDYEYLARRDIKINSSEEIKEKFELFIR